MGGDSMDAMALAIRVVSWMMMLVPAALGAWLGRHLLKRHLGSTIGMALGSALGAGWVAWTFFEDLSKPQPHLRFDVPRDFAHESVILIGDPRATTQVTWEAGDSLFAGKQGHLDVPSSGVVRVRTLGEVDGQLLDARLSDGKTYWAYGTLNWQGTRVVVFNFAEPHVRTEPALDLFGPEQLTRFLAAREAGQ